MRPRPMPCAVALAACLLAPGCSLRRPPERAPSSLLMDQGSFRMNLSVDPNGTLHLSDQAPLSGRIEAGPILAAEGGVAETLQVMIHLGRFYLTADGFAHLWEISPLPGTYAASYRPIPFPGGPRTKIRMSRYGPAGGACLRLDTDASRPLFLTDEGELDERCR